MILKSLAVTSAAFMILVVLAMTPQTTEVEPLIPRLVWIWIDRGLLGIIGIFLFLATIVAIGRGISWVVRWYRGRKAFDRVMEANYPLSNLMDRWIK